MRAVFGETLGIYSLGNPGRNASNAPINRTLALSTVMG